MCPYAIVIGEKHTYFLDNHYKFIKNDKLEDGTLLNGTDDSLDPFDYHLWNCGANSFKKLEYSQIHRFYSDIEYENVEQEENEDLIETKLY